MRAVFSTYSYNKMEAYAHFRGYHMWFSQHHQAILSHPLDVRNPVQFQRC